MSYIKLCQISNQTPDATLYLEDCTGRVIIDNVAYSAPFQCEIIDFGSEDNYNKRGFVTSFTSVEVTLVTLPVESIRKSIFAQLQATYPTLVI